MFARRRTEESVLTALTDFSQVTYTHCRPLARATCGRLAQLVRAPALQVASLEAFVVSKGSCFGSKPSFHPLQENKSWEESWETSRPRSRGDPRPTPALAHPEKLISWLIVLGCNRRA
jgi:hypothetical protein